MRELSSYHQLCNSAVELSPQAGASSDNSSPRSSTTEDDLLEIGRSTEQGGTSKPIYSFSIPDFIKHERQPVTSAANNTPTEESLTVLQNIERPREVKRRHDQRDTVETVNDSNTQGATNTSNCRKNKRRRVNQGTSDRSPEFIDLTDVADQDDTPSVRVLEEINQSPYLDSSIVVESPRELSHNRPQMSDIAVTYESVADDLQRFRRRLRESRERIDQIRREFTARESRFRNRLSHRSNPCTEDQRIVSDGPAYTSQSDVDRESQRHQAAANATPYDYRSTEAPVITLDDDGETATPNHEREVTRMILEDSLYSPPFLTPYTSQRAPSLETIEERIGEFHQRRLERAESVQRIRQQTQERINEVRSRLSRLDQHINNNDRQRIHISDSPQQESRQTEDEVEFLRELRPPQNIPTMPGSELPRSTRSGNADLHASNDPTYSWGHLSRRRRFSNLFSSADFLFPYVHFISPAATQRLHHFPSTFLDDGEDYEALWTLAERLGPAKPRGLSKNEIDRIQAFRYSQSRAEDTNSTCVVCMSEYCLKEKIRKLPCTHDFHSKCIDKWLKSNKTCPVCRDEVKCI